MTVIVTLKPQEGRSNPMRHVGVIMVLERPYSFKLMTERNTVTSYEKCDVENLFIQDFKDGR